MAKRGFGLALAALITLFVLFPAAAQDGAKPKRVGVLAGLSLSDPVLRRLWQTLVYGLREHGWEEGRNVVIEARFAGRDPARFPELAAELVALKVDVIVASNMQATEAARRNTATIPIVMASGVLSGSGFLELLAKPGGNVTGVVNQLETVGGKNLRSEEHTSELQSLRHLVCRLLLEKKKNQSS